MEKVMKRNLVKLNLTIIVTFLCILLLALGVNIPNFNSSASSGTLGTSNTVTMYNRADRVVNDFTESSYEEGLALVSPWQTTKSFVIRYVRDEEHLPTGLPTETEGVVNYTMTLTIEYKQVYLDNNFEGGNKITLSNVINETRNSLDELEQIRFTLNIDEGLSINDMTIGGWGIYRFTLSVNGLDSVSDYYFIEPTMTLNPELLQTSFSQVIAPNAMHYSYDFTLSNLDNFRYYDTSCFKWYVLGEANDGTRYAYISDDLQREDFAECTAVLYPSLSDWNRQGLQFHFNDNSISGKWTVWVEYQAHNSSDAPIQSEKTTVETGSPFTNLTIVYIFVAIAVVSIIVSIGIAIYKNKRERVW